MRVWATVFYLSISILFFFAHRQLKNQPWWYPHSWAIKELPEFGPTRAWRIQGLQLTSGFWRSVHFGSAFTCVASIPQLWWERCLTAPILCGLHALWSRKDSFLNQHSWARSLSDQFGSHIHPWTNHCVLGDVLRLDRPREIPTCLPWKKLHRNAWNEGEVQN